MIRPCYTFTEEDLNALFDGKSSSFSEAKLKLVAATGLDLDGFGKSISSFCLYRALDWSDGGSGWWWRIFSSEGNCAVLTGMLKETDLLDQAFSERYDWDWRNRRYRDYKDFERSFLVFRMMRDRLDDSCGKDMDTTTQRALYRFSKFLDEAETKVFKLPDEEGS